MSTRPGLARTALAAQPRTLPALLAEAVRRFGGSRVAVHGPSGGELADLTYGELDRRSAALRDALAPSVAAGELVPLLGHNSNEWVIAFFGLIRIGAVPVPLNPDARRQDLEGIFDELSPRVVVADRSLLNRLGEGPGLRIPLEGLEEVRGPASERREPPTDSAPSPDEMAVMLYTTGTTGRPKGVMLSHRNLLANVAGVIEATTLGTDDVVLVPLPLYHSFPLTTGCLAAIAAGVRVELESRPTRLAARLPEARPTLLIGVPALFELLLARARSHASGPFRRRYLEAAAKLNVQLAQRLGLNAGRLLFRPLHRALGGRLRYAICGGAPLAPELQRSAFSLGLPLLQGFGMTEASPVVSVQRFEPAKFWRSRHYWARVGSCGAPLAGVTVSIDPLTGADPGVGEIVVEGSSVMLGYFGREQETAEALRGGRLHTGDLGRIDEDGELWISGRSGLAVSTPRGKIVHLERVEQAIQRTPEVQQVAVVVEREPQWRLVAIVYPALVAAGAASAGEVNSRVRRACQAACRDLEAHERVGAVMLTDRPLPATPLGKIRRREVPRQPSFELQSWLGSVRGAAPTDRGVGGESSTIADS